MVGFEEAPVGTSGKIQFVSKGWQDLETGKRIIGAWLLHPIQIMEGNVELCFALLFWLAFCYLRGLDGALAASVPAVGGGWVCCRSKLTEKYYKSHYYRI